MRAPPVSEFTPDVEVTAALYDLVGALIKVVAQVNGAKKPPTVPRYPRPVTAFERARNRASRAEFDSIVAQMLPHKTT